MPFEQKRPNAAQPLGDENEHFWLVQRMAKATGVDLVRASNEGILSQEDWAGIVSHCRTCAWADGCDTWLSEPVDETRDTPAPCVNQHRLEALRTALAEPALEE